MDATLALGLAAHVGSIPTPFDPVAEEFRARAEEIADDAAIEKLRRDRKRTQTVAFAETITTRVVLHSPTGTTAAHVFHAEGDLFIAVTDAGIEIAGVPSRMIFETESSTRQTPRHRHDFDPATSLPQYLRDIAYFDPAVVVHAPFGLAQPAEGKLELVTIDHVVLRLGTSDQTMPIPLGLISRVDVFDFGH